MTPSEIAQRLASDAEGVAQYLLPQGKRNGAEWLVGNTDGDVGKSLGVHLSGTKAGVWSDFATGEAGDLLDLWVAVRRTNVAEAMKEAKSWLGIQDVTPQFQGHQPKRHTKPARHQWVEPTGPELEYLHSRGFTDETIAGAKLKCGSRRVYFPFIRGDETPMIKWRSIDSKDTAPTSADQEPCLFGWHTIASAARTVTICEGEFDQMSLTQYGRSALSVPFGGGKGAKQTNWIENEFDNLQRFDEIFLAMDNDKAGQEAVLVIAERLGVHRCRVVTLPRKDANQCLTDGIEREEIHACYENARYLDPNELKRAADFVDDVIRELYPDQFGGEKGFHAPWERTYQKLMFRRAELSVVNGVNGHGKSQLVGQIILSAMEQGERICIASMESLPKRLLMRLTKQAAGLVQGVPSIPYIRAIHEWYADKLWIFDVLGSAKTDRLLEVFDYARRRYGISVFVVDSLMKCGLREDDYSGQKLFVEALCDFKNAAECHVFLVTHSRKGENEDKPTGKWDVKGTGAITDLADNVFTIWRNKKKERATNNAQEINAPVPADVSDRPDSVLYCSKQRNGDWEGGIPLWWRGGCYQFMDSEKASPHRYVAFSQMEEVTPIAQRSDRSSAASGPTPVTTGQEQA